MMTYTVCVGMMYNSFCTGDNDASNITDIVNTQQNVGMSSKRLTKPIKPCIRQNDNTHITHKQLPQKNVRFCKLLLKVYKQVTRSVKASNNDVSHIKDTAQIW